MKVQELMEQRERRVYRVAPTNVRSVEPGDFLYGAPNNASNKAGQLAKKHNKPFHILVAYIPLDQLEEKYRRGEYYVYRGTEPARATPIWLYEPTPGMQPAKWTDLVKQRQQKKGDVGPMRLLEFFLNPKLDEQRQKGRSLPETGYKDRFARIYRAVLESETQFKPMDYVTLSRKFAVEHADHLAATEEENAHVLSALVESKNVYEAYNPGEYFYDGPPVKTRIIYRAQAMATEIVHGTTPNVGDNYEQEVGATWEQPDKPYGWS